MKLKRSKIVCADSLEYLIKMITPPNGIVLDCFAGSGSTGLACIKGGFRYVLIERESEYAKIAKTRLKGYKSAKKV